MPEITPKEMGAERDRWARLNAHEIGELRRTSADIKLRQLASLMASRELMPEDPRREEQVDEVRGRWARLRRLSR